jgi:hypothetical protein
MGFKNIFSGILIFAVVGLLPSCGGEADLVKPEIFIKNFNVTPKTDIICGFEDQNVFSVKGGEQIILDVIFSDNEALSQYKIDIHNNFDCHGHGSGATPGISLPVRNGDTEDWSKLIVKDIAGTKTEEKITLDIPLNVTAGVYHFIIQLIDQSGNDASTTALYSLKIKNPVDTIPPVMNVMTPTSALINAKKGDVITFTGNVTDDKNLGLGGNGMVFLSYLNKTSGNVFSTNAYRVFNNSDDTSTSFELSYTVPPTLLSGDYEYSLIAFDGVRNVSEVKTFLVKVE